VLAQKPQPFELSFRGCIKNGDTTIELVRA
jgi:hypothetical protein